MTDGAQAGHRSLTAILAGTSTWRGVAVAAIVLGAGAGASGTASLLPWAMGLWTGGLVMLLVIVIKPAREPGSSDIMPWEAAAAMWALAVILWWTLASDFDLKAAAGLAGTGVFSLVAGAIIGFLITAFGEENQSAIGKTRDWLFGGLAGLTLGGTLANLQQIKTGFASLAGGAGAPAVSIQLGNMAGLFALGFFAMFTLRRFHWNPIIARKQRELEEILRPVPLPLGAELKVQSGSASAAPTPEVVQSARLAVERIEHAGIAPTDLTPDLQLKYAAALAASDRTAQAASVLDQLLNSPVTLPTPLVSAALRQYSDLAEQDADGRLGLHRRAADAIATFANIVGPVADHLVGYHLLWVPDRVRESLAASRRYIEAFPDSAMTRFNAACALGQLFARGGAEALNYGEQAVAELEQATALDPRVKDLIRRWSADTDGDLHRLVNDNAFRARIHAILQTPEKPVTPDD